MNRPFVLSIAGFDPCGGAGVLSDIKTFESLDVQGLSVVTGITFQNDKKCQGVEWLSFPSVKKQLELLMDEYDIKAVKFGIIENWQILEELCQILKNKYPKVFITWDPIISSSSGYKFVESIDRNQFLKLARFVDLVIPNYNEAQLICGDKLFQNIKNFKASYVKSVETRNGMLVNNLYLKDLKQEITIPFLDEASKHGSGCAISACIASFIAKGINLIDAINLSEKYMQKFLVSSDTLLGIYSEAVC